MLHLFLIVFLTQSGACPTYQHPPRQHFHFRCAGDKGYMCPLALDTCLLPRDFYLTTNCLNFGILQTETRIIIYFENSSQTCLRLQFCSIFKKFQAFFGDITERTKEIPILKNAFLYLTFSIPVLLICHQLC